MSKKWKKNVVNFGKMTDAERVQWMFAEMRYLEGKFPALVAEERQRQAVIRRTEEWLETTMDQMILGVFRGPRP